jgi:uridine kinase
LDSFDYDSLEDLLLRPFATGERFRPRAFDHRTDRQLDGGVCDAPQDAVLILDGLFLHRGRLRARWDLSVLLDVSRQTAAARFERRDGQPPSDRYTGGQDIYYAYADPRSHASLVVPWLRTS